MNFLIKPYTSLSITTFLLISLFLTSKVSANWHYASEVFMGTEVSIQLWHQDPVQTESLVNQVWDEMRRIDNAFSTHQPDTLLSSVNSQAGKAAVPITEELFGLIQRSFFFSKISEGLFDITYATVGRFYDYRKKVKPSAITLENQLKHVNYENIRLLDQPKRIEFKNPKIKIDLGGIAKGHAVDRSIAILMDAKVKHAVVTAGGDSRYIGNHRDRPWHIGIRHPRDKSQTAFLLPIENESVSTSGDYERYFIDEKKQRHHHIIHPQSGKSPNEVVSVTVIGKEATTTDALSTTLFVAGIDEGLKIIHLIPDYDAIFIDQKGKVHYSRGLISPETDARKTP